MTPIYSLTFRPCQTDDHPNKIAIRNKKLELNKQVIPQEILTLIDCIGKDYVYKLQRTNKSLDLKTEASLSFSIEKGVSFLSCSDSKIKERFERISKKYSAIIHREELKSISRAPLIKRTILNDSIKKYFHEQLPDARESDYEFFDPTAFSLNKIPLITPCNVDVKFDIKTCDVRQQNVRVTQSMRYPHLTFDMSTRFTTAAKICIAGTGLTQIFPQATVPQFIETLSIFPQAHFTLLDNDPMVLDALHNIHSNKIAYYFVNFNSTFSKKYQMLFNKMIVNMNKSVIGSEKIKINSKKMFKLKMNQKKICVKKFDFIDSNFDKNQKNFDIVIATMSVSLALKNLKNDNHFDILLKFLSILNDNGSLYIDIALKDDIIDQYSEQCWALGINYLRMKMGREIEIVEIPLSDFMPNNIGNNGYIHNGDIGITTSNILVLTRKKESVQFKSEEELSISRKLSSLLGKK